MKRLSFLLALLGLAGMTALVGWFGANHVVHAIVSVGVAGMLRLMAWQLLLFVILGVAWMVIARPLGPVSDRGLPPVSYFIWGRMVRDAATTCLPLSPIGGFVAGASALGLFGVRRAAAAATTIADVTAEVLAQVAFTGIGLCILISKDPDTALAVPIAVAVGVGCAVMAAFITAQRGAGVLFGAIARRIAGTSLAFAQEKIDSLQAMLRVVYAKPAIILVACVIHLTGWIATGVGDWIAFRLLGIEIALSSAIAIAGLLNAVLAVAFVVPGHAGVQEAAYAGVGLLFGLPPDVGVEASLLRRARDLILGVPILLGWQAMAARRIRAAARGRRAAMPVLAESD